MRENEELGGEYGEERKKERENRIKKKRRVRDL